MVSAASPSFFQVLVIALWLIISSSFPLVQSDGGNSYYYSSSVVCQQKLKNSTDSGCANGELDLLNQQMVVSFSQVYSHYKLNPNTWAEAYEHNRKDRDLQYSCRDYCRISQYYCNLFCGGSPGGRRALRIGRGLGESENDDKSSALISSLSQAAKGALKEAMGFTSTPACRSFIKGITCQVETVRTFH